MQKLWLALVFVLGALFVLEITSFPRVRREHARNARIAAEIRMIKSRLESYKASAGAYPSTEQGLAVIGDAPRDPWENEYIYRYPGKFRRESYDIFSAGRDRKPDTPDDEWGDD